MSDVRDWDEEFRGIVAGIDFDDDPAAEDLVAETVTGYRVFKIKGNELGSWSHGTVWVPGENVAFCDRYNQKKKTVLVNGPDGIPVEKELFTHGPIPDLECECGFWVYKDPQKTIEKMGRGNQLAGVRRRGGARNSFGDFGALDEGVVLGEVQIWGRFVEGADGYRAEKARILKLFGPESIRPIAERYGVPLHAVTEPPQPKVRGWIQEVELPPRAARTGNYPPARIKVAVLAEEASTRVIAEAAGHAPPLDVEVREFKIWAYTKRTRDLTPEWRKIEDLFKNNKLVDIYFKTDHDSLYGPQDFVVDIREVQ